jgi:hypothetical protein
VAIGRSRLALAPWRSSSRSSARRRIRTRRPACSPLPPDLALAEARMRLAPEPPALLGRLDADMAGVTVAALREARRGDAAGAVAGAASVIPREPVRPGSWRSAGGDPNRRPAGARALGMAGTLRAMTRS